MPKVLSQAQVDQFWNEGYCAPFDCLTPEEAAAARASLEAYEASVDGPIDKHMRVKCHLGFMWLWDLVHSPKMLDAVEDLIGPNILLYLSTFWFKNPGDGKKVSWHQDSAYYGLEPHDVITLWLGFTESNEDNGCVQIIPRTHLGAEYIHKETYAEDNLLARGQTIEDIDDSEAVKFILKPGQFSMHHERLVHGSAPNRSNDRRMGMSFTFLPTHVKCTLPGRTAILCRGVDEYGYWGRDPEPTKDFDPECMDAIRFWIKGYADPNITQEALQTG